MTASQHRNHLLAALSSLDCRIRHERSSSRYVITFRGGATAAERAAQVAALASGYVVVEAVETRMHWLPDNPVYSVLVFVAVASERAA